MSKNIEKIINKNLSGKYNQKVLDHAKQFAADTLKTALKRAIQRTVEATGNLIGNKIDDRIAKILKTWQHNNEHDKEIPKERYISPEERQQVIDGLRLI